MITKKLLPFFLAALFALPLSAQPIGQVRALLTYRGFLSIDGNPVTGEVEFIFRIFKDATQSTEKVWDEEHTGSANRVKVENGHFSVNLGSIKPLEVGKTFLENVPLFLEIHLVLVNGQVKDETLEPRLELTTVPTSFVSQNTLNIRGMDPVKFFEDKDVKVKSLTIDTGGKINCTGCIDATSVDTGNLANDLVGSGLKVDNGKLVVDTTKIPDLTALTAVDTKVTTAQTTANTANTTANTANTTANTANSTANTANSTANTANGKADTNASEIAKLAARVKALEDKNLINIPCDWANSWKFLSHGYGAALAWQAGIWVHCSASGIVDQMKKASCAADNPSINICGP